MPSAGPRWFGTTQCKSQQPLTMAMSSTTLVSTKLTTALVFACTFTNFQHLLSTLSLLQTSLSLLCLNKIEVSSQIAVFHRLNSLLAGKSPMIGRYMEARRDIHPGEVKITKCPLLHMDHYHFRLKSLFKSHLSFSCESFSL